MNFKLHLNKLSKKSINSLDKIAKIFLYALVYFYRSCLSLMMGGGCRFEPTCSQYAVDAIKTYPFHKALFYITKRLLNCRPGGPFGYDPLPNPKTNMIKSHRGCC